MKSVLSFLTRLPLGHGDIRKAAGQQHLFPLVGVLIALIAYLVGCVSLLCFPLEIAALLIILSLYAVVGLLHLDGLADFSDGVMAGGDNKRKVAAMKDTKTGIAGIFSVLFILLFTFFCLREIALINVKGKFLGYAIPFYWLISSLILSEISAKLSMNTCIFFGEKIHDGIGATFIARSSPIRYAIAFSLAIILSLVFAFFYFWVILVGVLVGIIIVMVANRNFGGISGDSLGAANEIARVATLIVLVAIL